MDSELTVEERVKRLEDLTLYSHGTLDLEERMKRDEIISEFQNDLIEKGFKRIEWLLKELKKSPMIKHMKNEE